MTDDCDSGLFVLYYIQRFIAEAPKRLNNIPKVTGSTNPQIIFHVISFLTNECFWLIDLNLQVGFQPEEASNLRVKIQDLLKNEFHKCHKQGNIY